MKLTINTILSLGLLLLFFGCNDDTEPIETPTTGTIRFQMTNPISAPYRMKKVNNPDLTGKQTRTKTISLNFCVGDVWVSKNEVKEGEDDIPSDWVRLTSFTNRESMLFEDYSFPEVNIPLGEYKSVHLTFRNVFHRYAVLESDSNVFYELLETMGSWIDPCSLTDTSWVDPNSNYFSSGGNFSIKNGKYVLDVAGEKLTGFNIESGKTAVVSWRLGAGESKTCTTILHDANDNRKWDCGIDSMTFECPPEVKYMWDFVVDYE